MTVLRLISRRASDDFGDSLQTHARSPPRTSVLRHVSLFEFAIDAVSEAKNDFLADVLID
jgi:hypothetical protein